MNMYTISQTWELSALLAAFVVPLYYSYLCSLKERALRSRSAVGRYLPLLSFAASLLYFTTLGLQPIYIVLFSLGAMFASFIGSYTSKGYYTYSSIVLVAAIMLFLIENKQVPAYLLRAFGIGIIPTLVYFGTVAQKAAANRIKHRTVEIERDITQIIIGIITISIVAFVGLYIQYLFWLSLLIFVIIISTARYPSNRITKTLMKIEKPYARYGNGGLLLVGGSLLIVGFIHRSDYLFFFLSLILFADPLATLVGLTVKGPRLPYSRSKRLSGTLAFFLFGSITGYLLIGVYAIPLSFVVAIAESSSGALDDNVLIAVLSVVLYYLVV